MPVCYLNPLIPRLQWKRGALNRLEMKWELRLAYSQTMKPNVLSSKRHPFHSQSTVRKKSKKQIFQAWDIPLLPLHTFGWQKLNLGIPLCTNEIWIWSLPLEKVRHQGGSHAQCLWNVKRFGNWMGGFRPVSSITCTPGYQGKGGEENKWQSPDCAYSIVSLAIVVCKLLWFI